MARPGTVESSVLQVPFQLQEELISSGLAQAHRVRRVELYTEAQDQTMDIGRDESSTRSELDAKVNATSREKSCAVCLMCLRWAERGETYL